VGELLPDFELPDAEGRPIQFHKDRAGKKTVLVFYRSAVW
jgi:peroxiredoxin